MAILFCGGRRMALTVCLLMPALTFGQTLNSDQWKNVINAQKGREFPYTVTTRDSGCADGSMVSATGRTLTLKRKDQTKVTVARNDVLRVRLLNLNPDTILYSAGNFWLDVMEVPHNRFRHDTVVVFLRDGTKHQGPLLDTSESELRMTDGEKTRQAAVLAEDRKSPKPWLRISKADISEVYRVTFKRMSSSAEYAYSEIPILWVLDPRTWPAATDRGTLVLLYRAANSEDREPQACTHEL